MGRLRTCASVGCGIPRAILSTLMILMMVGLMGSEALISISSRVMPITDNSTMAKSNWFHLHTQTRTTTFQHTGKIPNPMEYNVSLKKRRTRMNCSGFHDCTHHGRCHVNFPMNINVLHHICA